MRTKLYNPINLSKNAKNNTCSLNRFAYLLALLIYTGIVINQKVTPLQQAEVPVHDTFVPMSDEIPLMHDTFVSMDDKIPPMHDTFVSMDDEIPPIHDAFVSMDDKTPPMHDAFVSMDDKTPPMHDAFVSMDDKTPPIHDTFVPMSDTLASINEPGLLLDNQPTPMSRTIAPVFYQLKPTFQITLLQSYNKARQRKDKNIILNKQTFYSKELNFVDIKITYFHLFSRIYSYYLQCL